MAIIFLEKLDAINSWNNKSWGTISFDPCVRNTHNIFVIEVQKGIDAHGVYEILKGIKEIELNKIKAVAIHQGKDPLVSLDKFEEFTDEIKSIFSKLEKKPEIFKYSIGYNSFCIFNQSATINSPSLNEQGKNYLLSEIIKIEESELQIKLLHEIIAKASQEGSNNDICLNIDSLILFKGALILLIEALPSTKNLDRAQKALIEILKLLKDSIDNQSIIKQIDDLTYEGGYPLESLIKKCSALTDEIDKYISEKRISLSE